MTTLDEVLDERMADLIAILNAANRVWTGSGLAEDEEVAELDIESNLAAYGLIGATAMNLYEKQTGTQIEVQPRVFDAGTVTRLIDQTTASIMKEYERDKGIALTQAQELEISVAVASNLYSGATYNADTDSLVVGSPLDTQTANPLDNYTNRWLNMKTSELQWDPTVPLKEHKMESALISGARDGTFDYATVGLILGQEKMIEKGIFATAGNILDVETEEQWEDQSLDYLMDKGYGFIRKFNRLSDAIDDTSADFYSNRRTRGNFKAHLESQVEKDAFTYFGPMETTLDSPSGDIQKFLVDENKRNGIFKEWIGGLGGAEKPNQDIKPGTDQEYSDYEKKGYRVANDKFVAELNKVFAQYMDSEGNPTANADSQAAISGMNVENWIWDQMYRETNKLFTTDPDTGMNAYQTIAADQTEAARKKKYQTNPNQINTDLKNALHNNPEFWVKGLPVDKKRVADEVWAQWEFIYANNAPEVALGMITGELEAGVVSGFERSDAEKQAKDLLQYGPNPIQWKDIPFEQQQEIISGVWQRGGVDVNTAFTEGGSDFDFASNIMDFARTGIDTNVFQDTFAKSSGRENVVRQFAINQGLLNENTSPAFMRHFTENIIPNLASKAEFSGATSMDDLNEVVGGYFDELEPYEKFESDFRRQMGYDQFGRIDTDTPPPVPGLSLSRYERKEAPPFSLQAIAGDLQNIQVDDPAFAEFIQQEMTLPGFSEEWRREGAEQLDEAAVASATLGIVGDEAFEQQERRLRELERSYEATLTREDLTPEERAAAEKRVADARKQYAREIGTGGGQSPEERARIKQAMEEDYQKAVARDQALRAAGKEGLSEQDLQKGEFIKSFLEQAAPYQEAIAGEKAKQAALQAEAVRMRRELETARAETVGTGVGPGEDPAIMEQVAKYSDAQLSSMQTAIEAKEREASALDVGIAGMQKAAAPAIERTTTAFRDEQRERMTTPGMTSAQFFESKLPGFERRYEQSPAFRLEQERKDRVAERETEQKQREYETQRKRKLRSGFGGRGRTVVTRGRA